MTRYEIKNLRIRLLLTQKEFAILCGATSAKTVADWESGYRHPCKKSLKIMKNLPGVSYAVIRG